MPPSRLQTIRTALAVCLLLLPTLGVAKKKELPTVRWTEGAPGCTFESTDDGHQRWTMSNKDLDMTLVVDSQELIKSRQRFYHPFSLYLSVHYKGSEKLEFPADLRLDFVRHHQVVEGYLDPTEFQNRLQNDLDTQVFETERKIKKDPSIKEQETARLQQYEKIAIEFIEFLTTQSLEAAVLTPGNPEQHGWVFFPTKNKWIGPFKPHEDFILAVWMKDKVWQFPFSLPPKGGEPVLRKPQE